MERATLTQAEWQLFWSIEDDGDFNPIIEAIKTNPSLANLRSPSGFTPLHYAATKGGKDVVEKLLQAGANTEEIDLFGKTVFHAVLHLDDAEARIEMLELLLNHHDKMGKNYEGYRLVSHAMYGSDIGTIQLLLKHGAPVDEPSENGLIPLHTAAFGGKEELVQLLLRAGANPSSVRDGTYTALASAIENEKVAILLLEAGANPNQILQQGMTALHYAVSAHRPDNNNLPIIKAMLEHKAVVDITDHEGRTPMSLALSNLQADIMTLLLNYGAVLDEILYDKKTPLQYALFMDDAKVVKLLLDHAANPNEIFHDHYGDKAALHDAIRYNRSEAVVKALLAYGADANADWEAGKPLHYAVSGNNVIAIRALLAAGADINAESVIMGTTPIEMAENKPAILALLTTAALLDRSMPGGNNETALANIRLACLDATQDEAEMLASRYNLSVKNSLDKGAKTLIDHLRHVDIALSLSTPEEKATIAEVFHGASKYKDMIFGKGTVHGPASLSFLCAKAIVGNDLTEGAEEILSGTTLDLLHFVQDLSVEPAGALAEGE